jgi:hypothetical protein
MMFDPVTLALVASAIFLVAFVVHAYSINPRDESDEDCKNGSGD